MSTKSLADKIKIARLDAKLSQRELSEGLMVSEKAVSSYESGRTRPTIQTLEQIAKKTDKPVWYFTDEGSEDLRILKMLANIEKELIQVKKLIDQSKRPS